jgi:cation:H+ antiporter
MIFLLLIIAGSLAIMLKAADFLVFGITRYAHKFGISDYLIGLIIIAMGASLPELVSSIMGSLEGESGIVLGTIFGSNLGGLTLVLGIIAIIGKKVDIKVRILQKTGWLIFVLAILPFVLLIDGELAKWEGAVLIGVWIGYNLYLWKKEGELGRIKKNIKLERIWRDAIIAVIALLAIILAGRWLVFSSIRISNMLDISPYIMALIVIGLGTQIPDLAVSIRAVLSGHQDVAFADVLGSLLTKGLLFLGVFPFIIPLTINPRLLWSAMIFTAFSLGLALLFTRKKKIVRWQGFVLIIVYLAFLVQWVIF